MFCWKDIISIISAGKYNIYTITRDIIYKVGLCHIVYICIYGNLSDKIFHLYFFLLNNNNEIKQEERNVRWECIAGEVKNLKGQLKHVFYKCYFIKWFRFANRSQVHQYSSTHVQANE